MIELYGMGSPNVVKIYIALEELGLPYTVHPVDVFTGKQFDAAFLKLNPMAKVPVITDSDGPGGKPITLFESGAILLYLADKAGALLPRSPAARYECLQWVFFQVGGIGPMFGQLGFFHKFAGKDYQDKRPRNRYAAESRRLVNVVNQRLATRTWIMGDEYSIADIAIFPMMRNLIGFYGAAELVGFADFPHVQRALDGFLARPAVARGLTIPKRA